MLALLNPAALLALTGLLVPVAIHLWNRRPGREIAVGSLRWLAAGANRRLRNLQLEQLWLLLLRAALLAVLAVAVAGPVWRTALPASRGVVLLSAEAAGLPALAGLKSTIDSLRRKGYTLRWLAAGFPRVSGGAWQQLKAGRPGIASDSIEAMAAGRSGSQEFAWARVQQAVASFPGQPLYVVTGAGLRNFGGSHAPLPAAVTWQALPDTTATAWLASAAEVGDSLRLLIGRSRETRTTFRLEKARRPQYGQPLRLAGLAALQLRPGRNSRAGYVLGPAVATPADSGLAVETTPLDLAIYTSPEYAADARYLEAALRAAGTALAIPPKVRRLQTRPVHLQAAWTFWLSAEPLPPNWQQDARKAGRHLWLGATGPGTADTAHLATTEPPAAAAVVLRRGSSAVPGGSETLWADGRGRAILSRQVLGQGRVYRLHTRLNPTWSELADDPQLPARLLELLQSESADNSSPVSSQLARLELAHDRRALDPAQLPSNSGTPALPATSNARPPTFRITDLRPWLVLLAGLLLLLERLLARRRDGQA
jgi:hypothetical protein